MGIEVDGELELDNVVTGRYATVRTVQRQSSAVNLLAFSPRDEVRRLQDEVCSLSHWFATWICVGYGYVLNGSNGDTSMQWSISCCVSLHL
jgi:hypothetical protein